MNKKTILIIYIFTQFLTYPLFSQKKEANLVIDLYQENNNISLSDEYFNQVLNPFDTYKAPKFKKINFENVKGIPENDSLGYYRQLDNFMLQYDLFKSGDISENDFLEIIQRLKLDTLNFSKVKLRQGINMIVGFNKNKQFIVADVNRNKDFSDDIKYEFDINFRNNPYTRKDFLNSLPVSEYTYETCYKGKIEKHNRKFILYPDKRNGYSRVFGVKENEYFSLIQFRDFWKGESIINNKKYEFVFNGLGNKFGVVYVKPKEIKFNLTDYSFNSQFQHELNDTVSIANNYYRIDSVNTSISKLYLRRISKKTNQYGSEISNYIKNFQFKDLNNKLIQSEKIIGKKKYTLLEFWGTWCGPCVSMTPRLKKLHEENSLNLNIISIANDDNIDLVKNYTIKHKMNWYNGFLSTKKTDNLILKQLKIKFFPTFILIDSKGKIIVRGSTDTFDEIIKTIQ